MFRVNLKVCLFVASLPLLLTFTGCDSMVKRQDFEIFQSSATRRLDVMGADLDVTKGATGENRQAIEVLQEQVQQLSEHVGVMNQSLDSKASTLETTFNKKLKTMMEEVLKENDRLIQEINNARGSSASSGTSSPSASSGSSTSSEGGSVNVYNKTATPEHDLNTGFYHTVGSGESLSKIAKRYQVPIDDITKSNGMDNPDSLYMGQKLFIPSPEGKESAEKPMSSSDEVTADPSAAQGTVTDSANLGNDANQK